MRILIVDDEAGKRRQVQDFIQSEFPNAESWEARSVRSAIDLMREQYFDLVVLDMRLTTYDTSAEEAGGRPRNFGGEELMRKMKRRGLAHPVVVLTQYTLFGDHGDFCSFNVLRDRLKSGYSNFITMIYFGQSNSQWKSELRTVLQKICEER